MSSTTYSSNQPAIGISYAHEDEDFASKLHLSLESKNYHVWRDSLIRGGQDYDERIRAAIEAVGALVVVWSKDAIASKFVKGEARHGLERNVAIPLLINGIKPTDLPYDFHSLNAIDFTEWRQHTDEKCYVELCRSLSALNVNPTYPDTTSTPASLRQQKSNLTTIKRSVEQLQVQDVILGAIVGAVFGFLVCSVLATDIKFSGYAVAIFGLALSGAIVAAGSRRSGVHIKSSLLGATVCSISAYIVLVFADLPVNHHVIIRMAIIFGSIVGSLSGLGIRFEFERRRRLARNQASDI